MTEACFERNEGCPYLEDDKCFKDTHHRYYYRRNYRTKVERIFRELPENQEVICRFRHDEIHANEEPPEKPSRDFMLGAISVSEVYLSSKKKRELGL